MEHGNDRSRGRGPRTRAGPPPTVDEQALEQFVGKALEDIGGAFAVLLSYIGDQTGVYRGLQTLGPCSAERLAQAIGVNERYLLEWLSAQAAGGYLTYHRPTIRSR